METGSVCNFDTSGGWSEWELTEQGKDGNEANDRCLADLYVFDSKRFFKDVSGVGSAGHSAKCCQVAAVAAECLTDKRSILTALSRLLHSITHLTNEGTNKR